MAKILRECNQCGEEYYAETRELKRGNGTYCKRECGYEANRQRQLAKYALILENNTVCAHCGKEFYLNESQKKRSKSGLYFCNRAHKEAAQKLGGLTAIHPPHYGTGTGKFNYRDRAIAFYGSACQNCGDDRFPEIIEVNHKDVNREHNTIENLEVLCPTCHRLFHWLTGTGYWKPQQRPYDLEKANTLFYRDLTGYFN